MSNHGGRQLDGGVATADALPDVVDAVAGRCPVWVDGGCGGARRWRRRWRWVSGDARAAGAGLAVDGADGVCEVLGTLRREPRRRWRCSVRRRWPTSSRGPVRARRLETRPGIRASGCLGVVWCRSRRMRASARSPTY
ncbi:MAG: alpha-hydroxy-acid oxidizing protein [Myxococcota bacterium]